MSRASVLAVRKTNDVRDKLRSFLDGSEPGLVNLLQRTWKNQERSITYKEIREAVQRDEINLQWMQDWQQDYAKFVSEKMLPQWEKAMSAAAAEREKQFSGWTFNPQAPEINNWTRSHAAEFVTNSTRTQIDGIRAVVHYAASGTMSVDELARAIRPMIGLTRPQSSANLRYYQTLREAGMSEKKAREKAAKYAEEQHRARAYTIARTELAYAYNRGVLEGAKQAQRAGLLGVAVKRWSTADDERVCDICESLDGVSVGLDGDFPFPTSLLVDDANQTPPAHPRCRCALVIDEIEPVPFVEEPPTIEGEMTEISSPADVGSELITVDDFTEEVSPTTAGTLSVKPANAPSRGAFTSETRSNRGSTGTTGDASWAPRLLNVEFVGEPSRSAAGSSNAGQADEKTPHIIDVKIVDDGLTRTNMDGTIREKLDIKNFPAAFSATKEERENTQKFIDYINSLPNADPDVIALLNRLKLFEGLEKSGLKLVVAHKDYNRCGFDYDTQTGAKYIELAIPLFTGSDITGQVHTTIHEIMHLVDWFCRADTTKIQNISRYSATKLLMDAAIKNTKPDIGKEVKALFEQLHKELENIKLEISAERKVRADKMLKSLKSYSVLPNGEVIA